MSPQEVEGLMEQTVRQVQETLNLEPDVAQHLLAHSHWGAEQLLQSYSENPQPLLLAAGLRVPQAQAAPARPDHCPVCVSPLEPDDDLPALCCMHCCCKVRPARSLLPLTFCSSTVPWERLFLAPRRHFRARECWTSLPAPRNPVLSSALTS